MEDIVRISLWLPDQQSLNKVLAAAKVRLDCGAPRRESDGTYRVTLYASSAEAKKISAMHYRHEVDENYGQVLKDRRKEVSQTDRFKGGKIKPTGLGERR